MEATNNIMDLMVDSPLNTFYKLSQATGLHANSLAILARADHIPPRTEFRTLVLIAEALGVTINDLSSSSPEPA